MDAKNYKKQRQQIMIFAQEAIKDQSSTSERPSDKLWFRKMLQKHHYLAGNKEFAFSVIDIEGRIYMNKIF